jgi:hypothetical protein
VTLKDVSRYLVRRAPLKLLPPAERDKNKANFEQTDLEPDQSHYNGPHEESAQKSWRKGVANFVALAFDFF